jgi:uridine kinase
MQPETPPAGADGQSPGAIRVVGIAGPSGSGKTTLAVALAKRSQGAIFALDSYYRDQHDVPVATLDVDTPDAIDVELAVAHLRSLIAGQAIDQPVYDFVAHARTGAVRVLQPAPVVLVEGLFALYWSELRELMHTRVFVTLDHKQCLRRRIERDVRERGRTSAEVTAQYEQKVRPMCERYVDPTRHHAHLVLDGGADVNRLTDNVLEALG